MAFPSDPTHIRAQLRAMVISSGDPSDISMRMIKPLLLGLYYEQINNQVLKNFRPVSPPIPFDMPSEFMATQDRSHKRGNATKKGHGNNGLISNPIEPKPTEVSASDVLEYEDSLVEKPGELQATAAGRSKKGKKFPLSHFFKKDISRAEGSISSSSSSLSLPSNIDQNTVSANSRNQAALDYGVYGSDVTTKLSAQAAIDGEQAIVHEMNTGRIGISADDKLGGLDPVDPDETLDYTSTDSAFTDIEADSIDISSSLMYDYTILESYVLENPEQEKKKRHKGKSMTSLLNSDKETPSGLSRSRPAPVMKRRSSLLFQKVSPAVVPDVALNLSSMIHSHTSSSSFNPLNYYSFVSTALGQGHGLVKIDFFVPPDIAPVFRKLQISSSTTVADCIGFILLKLHLIPERKSLVEGDFMNPNHWRMELIDEDGELYDASFGVLDRLRILASYNSPNCLAVTKVTNKAEVASNERQTPLPLDVRVGLEQIELKKEKGTLDFRDESNSIVDDKNTSIEIQVEKIPNTSLVNFFVSSAMNLGELLDLICQQYQLDRAAFRLVEVIEDLKHEHNTLLGQNLGGEAFKTRDLAESVTLDSLDSNRFRLVPASLEETTSNDEPMKHSFEAGITPSSATFKPKVLPPTEPKSRATPELTVDTTIIDKKKTGTPPSSSRPRTNTMALSFKPENSSNLTLGDLIQGKTPQLPTSLNTIYFKWKVWRKKSPLLNRLEKFLIIDGDYIHITPTDDSNWKKGQLDSPNSVAAGTGHHHYLHHYNYSKYYNDSMMKTSSFHITQVVKLKHYKQSKNPNMFKIVVEKDSGGGGKDLVVKKKYILEAELFEICEEIIDKINWALQVFNSTNAS